MYHTYSTQNPPLLFASLNLLRRLRECDVIIVWWPPQRRCVIGLPGGGGGGGVRKRYNSSWVCIFLVTVLLLLLPLPLLAFTRLGANHLWTSCFCYLFAWLRFSLSLCLVYTHINAVICCSSFCQLPFTQSTHSHMCRNMVTYEITIYATILNAWKPWFVLFRLFFFHRLESMPIGAPAMKTSLTFALDIV